MANMTRNGAAMPHLDTSALEWLALQGACFVLPKGRTKGTLYEGWQDIPNNVAQAIAHAQRGGNVGLLTGTYSAGIIALDIDRDYLAVAESLGPYANTARVERTNAPNRGKLLYRVEFAVESQSWKPEGERAPWAELLSNGRHAVVPPSEYEGGQYVLKGQQHGIATLTDDDLAFVWYKATEGRVGLPEPVTTLGKAGQATRTTPRQDDAKSLVLDAWSTLEVFKHHRRATEVQVERNGEHRLLGNGGLLIKANGEGWYSFADSKGGGDAISAWAYCTRRPLPLSGKTFWEVLREMAAAKGLSLPDTRDKTTRARQSSDDTDASDDTDDASNSVGDGKTGQDTARKPNQAEILYNLASDHAEIFTAQDGTAYAFVPVSGRRECYPLSDSNFSGWLTALYRAKCNGAMPGAEGRKEAIAALTWDARTIRRDVFVRVGGHGGKVYIDLGTEEWDAVEIDTEGWRIVSQPPVAFRRSPSLKPLPLPIRGARLSLLREYINIEPEDWPLVAGWLVAAANPSGPYPVLVLAGEQGTAKSTTIRTLKEILDPAVAGLRGQPDDIRDLWVGADNSWLLAYDNVSHLNNDVSDALCRLATGGGYAKRANYTDSGEFVMDAQRPVAINGIGDIVTRPDLMDRTILISPPVITESKRRNEKEFWGSFNQDRAKLLGALLDAVSLALRNVDHVQLDSLPRMADFARLAVAAEPAFGADLSFMEAYNLNREEAHAAVVETSSMGEHLRQMVLVSGTWEGTASELLQALNERASESEQRSQSWPKIPNRVKPALQRLAPSLRHIGVEVEFPPRSDKGGTRRIRLVRLHT
jgi:hypothetical protein